jgi:hypothetical protein
MATVTPLLTVKGAKNLVRIINIAPPVSVENTLHALKDTYIDCPKLDRKLLQIWFDRFRQENIIAPLAQDYKYLWFKETFKGYCSPLGSVAEVENQFDAGYELGEKSNTQLDIKTIPFISSINQILDDRKVQVEGAVYCPLINEEPLNIRQGYWQIMSHEVAHLQTDSNSLWLQHYYELEDAQGNKFWLEGHKCLRLGWDIWQQTSTLNVSIRGESGQSWIGQTRIPADTYIDEQVRGLRMDESISDSDRKRSKLIWLFLLWGSAGIIYLKLLARFGSNNVYEFINKK